MSGRVFVRLLRSTPIVLPLRMPPQRPALDCPESSLCVVVALLSGSHRYELARYSQVASCPQFFNKIHKIFRCAAR